MSGWAAIFNNTNFALTVQSEALARFQEQIASGQRVIRASDDPGAAHRIMYLKAFARNLESYERNLGTVESNLEQVTSCLTAVTESLSLAREKLTRAVNGTFSAQQRAGFAGEIETAIQMILMVANRKHAGQYLFGGSKISTVPYVATYDSAGRVVSVTYNGGTQDLPVPVAPGVEYSGVVVAEDMFKLDNPTGVVFLGQTGAAAGTGTSTIEGDVSLEVSRETVYGDTGGTNVAEGDSADTSDTIRGDHTLTIDTNAKTIKLDDGTAVSYDGVPSPTDFMIQNASGDVAYVDVSNITPDIGTVDVTITGRGLLSIDGGLSTHQTDYTDTNLAVSHSQTGLMLYVNTTGITQCGTEPVNKALPYDMFVDLIAIRDNLLNSDGALSVAEQNEELVDGLNRLEGLLSAVTNGEITVGSKLQAVGATIRYMLEDLSASSLQESSQLQDLDLTEAVVQLARTQTLYEMILASSSRLLNLSLLDYI
ncbi:MAG: flagellar hook-associated protein FlgL [Phycisphaerae bacterium]|nr:flagellar hook-associated protein FlgL [Phycisphaerae bacterium]